MRVALACPYAWDAPGGVQIYLAAVNERMAEAAGRIADGISGHPMTSPRWLSEVLRPAIERGARAAGRLICRGGTAGVPQSDIHTAESRIDREAKRRKSVRAASSRDIQWADMARSNMA